MLVNNSRMDSVRFFCWKSFEFCKRKLSPKWKCPPKKFGTRIMNQSKKRDRYSTNLIKSFTIWLFKWCCLIHAHVFQYAEYDEASRAHTLAHTHKHAIHKSKEYLTSQPTLKIQHWLLHNQKWEHIYKGCRVKFHWPLSNLRCITVVFGPILTAFITERTANDKMKLRPERGFSSGLNVKTRIWFI